MNIMLALNAVPIHEASSAPRCRAPLISINPTLIRRPVQVAIEAPSSTPNTPNKGCIVITAGVGDVGEDAGVVCPVGVFKMMIPPPL